MKIKQNKVYNIGENIQKIRKQRKMTQSEVVTYLQILGFNVSREILSQIERGEYNIRVEYILALSELFDVEIQEFFNGLTLEKNEDKE